MQGLAHASLSNSCIKLTAEVCQQAAGHDKGMCAARLEHASDLPELKCHVSKHICTAVHRYISNLLAHLSRTQHDKTGAL